MGNQIPKAKFKTVSDVAKAVDALNVITQGELFISRVGCLLEFKMVISDSVPSKMRKFFAKSRSCHRIKISKLEIAQPFLAMNESTTITAGLLPSEKKITIKQFAQLYSHICTLATNPTKLSTNTSQSLSQTFISTPTSPNLDQTITLSTSLSTSLTHSPLFTNDSLTEESKQDRSIHRQADFSILDPCQTEDADDEETEYRCSICLTRDNTILLRCHHAFCHCCIDNWLQIDRTCPTCRDVVTSAQDPNLWEFLQMDQEDCVGFENECIENFLTYLIKI
mmetsp:Transcript_33285/g.37805  ORF Transcript_33285/g.37805 Transcript_33285/m.37805 type:complete len:280 (+) Transcript_33285:79-918(+)